MESDIKELQASVKPLADSLATVESGIQELQASIQELTDQAVTTEADKQKLLISELASQVDSHQAVHRARAC